MDRTGCKVDNSNIGTLTTMSKYQRDVEVYDSDIRGWLP